VAGPTPGTWAGPAEQDQEENVVAVTGDDNSGGLTTTDAAGAGGDVPAAGHQPGEESVGTDAGLDQDAAERADLAEPDASADDAAAGAGSDEADSADADQSPVKGDGEADGAEEAPSLRDLEQESEIAADYIEGLLDVADLDGDIDMDVEGDRPVVSVVGATLDELVGPRGEVLEALQELTRLAVHRQTGARSRIMLDVGGYRAKRRRELAELGRNAAEQVSKTGVPQRLQAMTPFERKVIHDAVAAAGLRSESEGEEPDRRVVVLPAGDTVAAGVGEPANGQGTGT
jgi:spoIIIJ-associated protein